MIKITQYQEQSVENKKELRGKKILDLIHERAISQSQFGRFACFSSTLPVVDGLQTLKPARSLVGSFVRSVEPC